MKAKLEPIDVDWKELFFVLALLVSSGRITEAVRFIESFLEMPRVVVNDVEADDDPH